MSNKATLDKFHEFGSRSIGDMVDIIYVIKPLLFWKNYLLYSINRAYYISNTPWTKVMKLVLNSIILYSKCIDTIKFVPFWNWLEPFLEYLQKIHVNWTNMYVDENEAPWCDVIDCITVITLWSIIQCFLKRGCLYP